MGEGRSIPLEQGKKSMNSFELQILNQVVRLLDARIQDICEGRFGLHPLVAEQVVFSLAEELGRLMQKPGLNEYKHFLRSKGFGKDGRLIVDAFLVNLSQENIVDFEFFESVLSSSVSVALSSFVKHRIRSDGTELGSVSGLKDWLTDSLHAKIKWRDAPIAFLGASYALEAYIQCFEDVLFAAFPKLCADLNLGYRAFTSSEYGVPSVTLAALKNGSKFADADIQFQKCWRKYVSNMLIATRNSSAKLESVEHFPTFCQQLIDRFLEESH